MPAGKVLFMCCQDFLPHKGARPVAIAHGQSGVAVHAVEPGIISQISSRPWPNSTTQAGFGAANDWDNYLQAADARCANPAVADPLTCKAGKRKRAPRDCRWAECDNKQAQGRPSFLTMPYTGKAGQHSHGPLALHQARQLPRWTRAILSPGRKDFTANSSATQRWHVPQRPSMIPSSTLKCYTRVTLFTFTYMQTVPSADLHAPYTAEMQSDPAAPINRLRQILASTAACQSGQLHTAHH